MPTKRKGPPKVLWVNWYDDSGELGSFNFDTKGRAEEAGRPKGKPLRYVLAPNPRPRRRKR